MGLKPGSVIEWTIEGDKVTVTRVVKWSTQSIHQVLFGDSDIPVTTPKNLSALKQGIRENIKKRHARD
jgi:hypothetical protein